MELTGATLDTPQSSNNPDYAEVGAGTGAVQAVEIWDTPGAPCLHVAIVLLQGQQPRSNENFKKKSA